MAKNSHTHNKNLPWILSIGLAVAGTYILVDKFKSNCDPQTNVNKTTNVYNNNNQGDYSQHNTSNTTRSSSQAQSSTRKQQKAYEVTADDIRRTTKPAVPASTQASIDSLAQDATYQSNGVPGALPNASNNPALIDEWLGVKKYDEQNRQSDVVNHHYKTRSMKTKSPCNN